MNSFEYLAEKKALEILRARNPPFPCVGLLERVRTAKKTAEDSTISVRVFNKSQMHGRLDFFMATLQINLNVYRADDANGLDFADAFDSVDNAVMSVVRGFGSDALTDAPFMADGAMLSSTDSSYDEVNDAWSASWEITIMGRYKYGD